MKMAATMMPAAEMVATTAVMTAAPATTVTATMTATVTASMTTAAPRDGKVRYRQHRCEDNGGNSQRDL